MKRMGLLLKNAGGIVRLYSSKGLSMHSQMQLIEPIMCIHEYN